MKLLKKVLLPFICVAFIAPMVTAQNKPVDKIEAVVNQEVILTSDLTRMQKDLLAVIVKVGKHYRLKVS